MTTITPVSEDVRVLPERPAPTFQRAPATVQPAHAQRIAGLLTEWSGLWAAAGATEDATAARAVAALLRTLGEPVRLKQKRNKAGARLTADDWLASKNWPKLPSMAAVCKQAEDEGVGPRAAVRLAYRNCR
jgi:hypothetical protein